MEESVPGRKCRFQAIYCSSEEPGFTADQVNIHSVTSQGWQTLKFCEYPQELGLRIVADDDDFVNDDRQNTSANKATKCLTQLQLLSHESKISTRIELYIGTGDNYHQATFTRLGFMALDGNDRTEHRARELKTVYIDQRAAQYVRLIVHRPHKNHVNLFGQVGIVAINLLGLDPTEVAVIAARKAGKVSNSFMQVNYADNKNDEFQDEKRLQQRRRALQEKESKLQQERDAGLTEFTANGGFSLASRDIDARSRTILQLLAQAKADAVALDEYDLAKVSNIKIKKIW